jgi:thiamine pyrophosphokinase
MPLLVPFKIVTDFLSYHFQDTQERLQQEEDARNQLFQGKKKLEQEISGLKKDIEDLELSVQKVITNITTICVYNIMCNLNIMGTEQ